MEKNEKRDLSEIRINPYQRLCPIFDKSCFALFPTDQYEQMGFTVQDDTAHDHIQ